LLIRTVTRPFRLTVAFKSLLAAGEADVGMVAATAAAVLIARTNVEAARDRFRAPLRQKNRELPASSSLAHA